MVNAQFPSPVVYANHEMSHRMADMIMGALVQFWPGQVMACSQGTSAVVTFGGLDPRNDRRYVSYETIKGGFGARPNQDGINTVASAWTVARDCGEPDATVVADVFHMIRGGGSVDDLLTLQGDRLAVFHINDLPARPDPRVQADSDRVMPGDGIADLPRVIRNLRAIGYRGPLSLELFNPGLWARNPAEVLKVGIERLRALVNSESD